MPSAIPYDPSISLGNLVSQAKLDLLTSIAEKQAPADDAEDQLNDLISLRHSFDMTMSELLDLDVDITDLQKQRDQTNKDISAAAVLYAKAKTTALTDVMALKKSLKTVGDSPESPIDWVRSQIKNMPISADSMKMNVQYFAREENDESGSSHTASVSGFVSGEVDWMGDSFSAQASAGVQSAVSSNVSRHDIVGTLVLSISCTHKVASVFAPYVLDVDKAIRVWNMMGLKPLLDNANQGQLAGLANQTPKPDDPRLNIVSGATYGSCFIGMVHVLNTKNTVSYEALQSLAAKAQAQIKLNMMVENETAGGGFSKSSADDIKSLLSTQNISSHCSVVAVGSIPSIKSNTVTMAVKMYADNDPATSVAQLAAAQNATATAGDSLDSSAEAARTGNQLVMMKNAQITATLSALKDGDTSTNQIIDTNSLMIALDDYIQKALAGNVGVPIMYFLKAITAQDIAQSWVAKYFPGKFLAPSGDDSKPDTNGGGGGGDGGGASS